MGIAVACDGLSIAPRFVACSSYMCYDVSAGSPRGCRNISAADQPLDKLPDFLHAVEADTLIAGAVDDEVVALLESRGITVIAGRSGDPLHAVEEYLNE